MNKSFSRCQLLKWFVQYVKHNLNRIPVSSVVCQLMMISKVIADVIISVVYVACLCSVSLMKGGMLFSLRKSGGQSILIL